MDQPGKVANPGRRQLNRKMNIPLSPQGSSERVLPWQVTMDRLICASLSHPHYWYEVGMLKSRVWINRVRLPILLVVSWTGKMNISLSPFAPENLVSRDGFGRPVPRQPAHLHTQAEFGAYSRDSSRFPRRRAFIYLSAIRHWVSPEFYRVTPLRTDGVQCRESAGTGPANLKVFPNGHHGPTNMRLSFSRPLLVWSEHVESTGVITEHWSFRPRIGWMRLESLGKIDWIR